MAKIITIEDSNKTYTLEYTRATAKIMESKGIIPSKIDEQPNIISEGLFAGAFLAHHRGIKPAIVEKLFDKVSNRRELINGLIEMFNEPLEEMMTDPEDNEGNATWGKSW